MNELPAQSPWIPPYHAMMWPVLQALIDLGGSGSNIEIEDSASAIMALSDGQLSVIHGNGPQTEVRYRMAWARSYLKKYGAVENRSRSVWTISEFGKSLSPNDMSDVVATYRAAFPRKTGISMSIDVAHVEIAEEDADASDLVEATSITWREQLLELLQDMPPVQFERLCQRLLRESGFTKVDVTGRSGDGGIDGVGMLRIALLSFQVFFQCKRYKGSVGASAIRDFRGAMVGRTDKGLLITTGTFTSDAKREATRDGAPVLDLIDGDALCTLLKEQELGVTTELVEAIRIEAEWYRQI